MTQTGRGQLSARDRWLVLLGAAAIVGLLVFLYQPVPKVSPYRDLAVLEPLPPLSDWLGEAEIEAATADSLEAMSLYRAGQYQRYVLAASNAEAPSEVHRLYLGSAQLLAGHLTDAIFSLRQLIASPDSTVAAEASWLLAQAYLASDDPSPARDELERLVDRHALRAADAKAKLAVLKSRMPKPDR